MNARYDFAHAGFDTCLLTEIGDIFTGFSDDDAGLFCADEGAESQRSVLRGWRRKEREWWEEAVESLNGKRWEVGMGEFWERKWY